jgi:orotidine-5'-phosphate decarboxylase
MTWRQETLKPYQRIVFPLDLPDWKSAAPYVQALAGRVGFFKIGLELFISEGPEAIRRVREIAGDNAGIFLDLKLHDIPATVGRAMSQAARWSADLVTVHAGDGRAVIKAAVDNAGGARVLAVTVLTSLDLAEPLGLADQYTRPMELVKLRAQTALAAGCDGFVCAGTEAAAVREIAGPKALIVTPGIRPQWSLVEGDDQKRVLTPAKALAAGADLLVIGRPIRDADDPAAAADRAAEEMS